MTSKRVWTVFLASLAVFAASALLLPLLGSVQVDYGKAWAGVEPDHTILFAVRVPRVLLALLAGGSLALAGVLFQALLRDALATPYTLGISSGASFGAVLSISFGLGAIWLWAIGAGMLTLFIVLAVAANRRMLSPFTLLMAGITINSIATAGILFLHSVATYGQSVAITRWLMGGVEHVEMRVIGWLSLAVLPAVAYSFLQARQWNVLAVGEEWAHVRGVQTNRLLLAGYLVGSLLTGAVTSLTGPIGFVGLIVPHAVRLSLGADHRLLIPASFLLGGAFLAGCDTVARIVLSPAEVPVGVITAMIGGPFFIYILRRR